MEYMYWAYEKVCERFGGLALATRTQHQASGSGSGGNKAQRSGPRKVIAFGNVLLDRTVHVPASELPLLDRYQITLNQRGELSEEVLAEVTAEFCRRFHCVVNPGGSALNTVRILKQLGTEALFLGAVGEDKHADELKDVLKQKGVDANLQTVSSAPTGRCICLVHGAQEALYAFIGASAKFSMDHLKKLETEESQHFLRPTERKQIVYIEGFFLPQREEVCEYIVQCYIRDRRRLALNLSSELVVHQNGKLLQLLARHAYFLFGNEDEFTVFAESMGCESIEEAARRLMTSGEPKVILITKHAQGVDIISNVENELSAPGDITVQSFNAPRVETVVDTTGAGDSFVAGFLHAWLEKRSVTECVRLAIDIASKVVTQVGCNLPSST